MRFPKLSHYKSVDQLRARLVELEIEIPVIFKFMMPNRLTIG